MKVERIDHVHVEVADRDGAARWYQRVLGLQRHDALQGWAADPRGPLILKGADGFPTLSLFAAAPKEVSRDATVAFRVSGEDFVAFVGRLGDLKLTNRAGETVSRAHVVDHEMSWSIYFCDPDGNRLELTTYDHDRVRTAL